MSKQVGAVVVGGDYQGLGIARSLGRRGIPVCVIDDERSIARYSRYTTHAVWVESLRDQDAVRAVLDIGDRLQLDGWVLYPTREETVAAFSGRRDELGTRFRVPTPAWETIRWAWDKRKTYELATQLSIAVPRTWYPKDAGELLTLDAALPLVIKPAIKEHFVYATGAKAWKARTVKELTEQFQRARSVVGPGEVMVQDFIPGDGAHQDFGRFKGRRVAVVGGGQSAIESAALLQEAGAHVELIARRTIRWLKLHDYRGPGRRILYAPSDVGPPGLNWLLHFPLVFRLLPARVKPIITRRAVRPAGARWLIDRVLGRVRITSSTQVLSARVVAGGVRLELSVGTTRLVDHVFLATGYRPNLNKLAFIAPSLRQGVRQRDGLPVLNRWLESSVTGLHFAGGLADQSYGPICRFVSGADVAARRITAYATRMDARE